MIAKAKRTTPALTPAACYIRMSSDKQDRSPAQQRAEIAKLAAREGCYVAPGLEFIDEGITGDSGPDQRPGFKAMLAAAAAGRFKVLLAYDQDRVGRFDSLDAGKWLAPIRDSGVRIVTVVQGHIDLESSGGRIIYTVNQEAKKAFLIEHAAKTLRGKLATAARGGRNGGVLAYGMDRGLFDAAGALVRRLAPGESVRLGGHVVRALPSTDQARVAAVRFAFDRFTSAAVSFRALAGELAAQGFPPPPSGRWNGAAVAGILRNPLYCGVARFGACSDRQVSFRPGRRNCGRKRLQRQAAAETPRGMDSHPSGPPGHRLRVANSSGCKPGCPRGRRQSGVPRRCTLCLVWSCAGTAVRL